MKIYPERKRMYYLRIRRYYRTLHKHLTPTNYLHDLQERQNILEALIQSPFDKYFLSMLTKRLTDYENLQGNEIHAQNKK